MNEYLENLVRIESEDISTEKGTEMSVTLPEDVENAVDIPQEVSTPIDEFDSFIHQDAKEEQESDETIQQHEINNENDVKADDTEVDDIKADEKADDAKTEETALKVGQQIDASNIRIYNSPDVHQVSKLYSGKVIYTGQIDRFAIVKYMKHGFGLVQGYTKDLI